MKGLLPLRRPEIPTKKNVSWKSNQLTSGIHQKLKRIAMKPLTQLCHRGNVLHSLLNLLLNYFFTAVEFRGVNIRKAFFLEFSEKKTSESFVHFIDACQVIEVCWKKINKNYTKSFTLKNYICVNSKSTQFNGGSRSQMYFHENSEGKKISFLGGTEKIFKSKLAVFSIRHPSRTVFHSFFFIEVLLNYLFTNNKIEA